MRRYVIVALAVAAALALNLLLVPWIRANTFPLFLVAVMAVAWYGGLGPGLAAIAVATLANAYFFVTPGQVLGIANASDVARHALLPLPLRPIYSTSRKNFSAAIVSATSSASEFAARSAGVRTSVRPASFERRLRFEPGRVVLVTSENDALVVR
jgi:hypothetical protein